MHKAACVQFSMNLQSLMIIQWINSSMNSQLVDLPTILDNLFQEVVNATITPVRVLEGGGWWVGTKWQMVRVQKFLFG